MPIKVRNLCYLLEEIKPAFPINQKQIHSQGGLFKLCSITHTYA